MSPPPLEDDVDTEEVVAEARCLAHSPPLNSHPTSGRDGENRRRRWYFRVALLKLSAAKAVPQPSGALGGLQNSSQVSAVDLVFLLLRIGRQARSGLLPPAFLLPSGLEAAAYLTVIWNPGTRVLTRIIVAFLTGLPGAQCPSAVSSCFRRERWPGSDPGGGRTRAALYGEL